MSDPNIQRLISASLFLHPGFLIVDHIHFQYNGFLFGILLLSILQARQVLHIISPILAQLNPELIGKPFGQRFLLCGLTEFQAHIYVPRCSCVFTASATCFLTRRLQPAYFVYLLRAFCMSPQGSILPNKFFALANVVILVFIASLGPFLLMGQVPQLLSRLFPFTRGLNHAYWAPNAWAVLTAADRVLVQCK